jgi:HK97 family phage prohead protease
MADLEIRQFGFRAARPTVGDDNKLSGRAAPFNSPTMIGTDERGFREQIAPGAFNKSIQDGDVVLLNNHNPSQPLARQSAGTLELHAGTQGLDWRASASDTSYARDVVANVRAGNYGGCSFSFSVPKGGETWDENTADGIPLRTIREMRAREISIVTFPAYKDTDVYARSIEMGLESRAAYWAPIMEGEVELDDESRDPADGDGPGPVSHMGKKKPYGDVKYADPKNGKYPINTEAHVRAAWAYINMPKNAAKYPLNGVTVSEVKARIIAAAKKFGIKISEGQHEDFPDPDERSFELGEMRLVVPVSNGQWSRVSSGGGWKMTSATGCTASRMNPLA